MIRLHIGSICDKLQQMAALKTIDLSYLSYIKEKYIFKTIPLPQAMAIYKIVYTYEWILLSTNVTFVYLKARPITSDEGSSNVPTVELLRTNLNWDEGISISKS